MSAATVRTQPTPAARRHVDLIRSHGWRIACAAGAWEASHDLQRAADLLRAEFGEAAAERGTAIGELIARIEDDAAEQLESATDSATYEELEDALGL